MATEKQINANRLNAEKSTGPTTEDGKAKSAANSIKHGLLAKTKLLSSEKPEDYSDHRNLIFEAIQPVGKFEELLTEKIVVLHWRLNRLLSIECDILSNNELDEVYFNFGKQGPKTLGTRFKSNTNSLSILSRYESMLERTLIRVMNQIERLQDRRNGKVVLPPVVVDITEN